MIDPVTAISTVGFPIVAFFVIIFRQEKAIKNNTVALQELLIYIKTRK